MANFEVSTLRVRLDRTKTPLFWAAFAALLVIAGCGGSYTPAPGSPGSPAPLTAVVVTPATATLHRGETQQFAAKVSGSSNQTVTWQVTNGIGTIDGTGLYTAPSDFDGGVSTITATSNAVPAASGAATVTLPAVSFSITPDAIAVALGASQPFTATLVGLGNTQVAWTVLGADGGTINSVGLYTAPSTSGIYSVVATSAENSNYGVTATVVATTNPKSFSPTGKMQDPHVYHTATLLNDGRVLVAGGATLDINYFVNGTNSAELYDPLSGTFALTGTMTADRYAQTATLLPAGEILITGGISDIGFDYGETPAVDSAELFDASAGSFALTGKMAEARGGHTATLLNNNTVLVAGGANAGGGSPFYADGSKTAEIYDPLTKVFTSTGNMVTARVKQTATLLLTGKVLIAGGSTSSSPIAAAELYDPGTGVFTPTGNMTSPRIGHTATLLQDGRVLVTGGGGGLTTAEIYDPATGSFLATGSMAVARSSHTATLLPNGTVLVVDGGNQIAEIYDPATGLFSLSAVTESIRSGHSATLLQDGRVLVVGGESAPTTAEFYP
jgi:hypothetical protein